MRAWQNRQQYLQQQNQPVIEPSCIQSIEEVLGNDSSLFAGTERQHLNSTCLTGQCGVPSCFKPAKVASASRMICCPSLVIALLLMQPGYLTNPFGGINAILAMHPILTQPTSWPCRWPDTPPAGWFWEARYSRGSKV